jgi:hypothetical protein
VVLAISPLEHNWAVKYLSHHVYGDLTSFEQALAAGEVLSTITKTQRRRGN